MRHLPKRLVCIAPSFALLCAMLSSCVFQERETDLALPSYIKRFSYSQNGNGQVVLSGLSNNDIFLVKVNKTINASNVSRTASHTSMESLEGLRLPVGTFVDESGKTLYRYEYHPASGEPNSMPVQNRTESRTSEYTNAYRIGDKKKFWVDLSAIADSVWVEKSATIRAIGQYCKVWVLDDYFSQTASGANISSIEAEKLAAKFDEIYPLETNLLGFEYGGGPAGNGGADKDNKIQILVYDIDGDFEKSRDGVVMGYFYRIDELSAQRYTHSNEAEIFYIDSEMLNVRADWIYSTLVHEFNHMINYNIKVLRNNQEWESWYTEMLSTIAEDVIAPKIGIAPDNTGHPIKMRLPSWAYETIYPWIEWNQSYSSYSPAFAFGAYLARNFGGAQLIESIAKNRWAGYTSLDRAIKEVTGWAQGLDYAAFRFGEALVYSYNGANPEALSLNKTVTRQVGDFSYTFFGIPISRTPQPGSPTENYTRVYGYDPVSMPAYTAGIIRKWLSFSGDVDHHRLTINIQNKDRANIEYFVMIR